MSNELEPRSWHEFRGTGLLWLVNTTLHVFGWAIVVEKQASANGIVKAYPARVPWRGFPEERNDLGYRQVAHYMAEEAKTLLDEIDASGENR